MNAWRAWGLRVLAAAMAMGGMVGVGRADVVVVQSVQQNGRPPLQMQVVIKVKGHKIRADMGDETSLIMDTVSGSTITLRHPQKTAMELSGEAAAQLMEKAEELHGTQIGKPRLESAGKGTETVAGRETRRYSAQAGAMRVTWWVAQKQEGSDPLALAFETLQKAPMVRLAGGLTGLPDDLPGVPVKTEMIAPDGRIVTSTVVSVKEDRLDAVDFAVPNGYRRLAGPVFGSPTATPAR